MDETNKDLLKHIDLDKLESLLQDFYNLTGFVVAFLDLEGNILAKSDWKTICSDFHRANKLTSQRCNESDIELGSKLAAGKKFHSYKCLNGLIDVAVPVMINNLHVANLYCGQFFYEKPDRTFFIRQAEKFGYDKDAYLKALDEIPIVSEAQAKKVLKFLTNLTVQIGDITLEKVQQEKLNNQIKASEEKFSKQNQQYHSLNEELVQQNEEYQALNEELRQTNDELTHALKTIEANEKTYRTLFENAPIMLGILNSKGIYQDTNKAYNILGYSNHDLHGKDTFEYVHKEDRKTVLEKFTKAIKAGTGEASYRFKHKNGEFRTITSKLAKIPDSDNYIVFSDDITEKLAVEQELIENKEKYQMIFETAANPITSVNQEGIIVDCNNKIKDVLGYEKNEIIGHSMFEIIHADYHEKATKSLGAILTKGYLLGSEYVFVKKDGSKRNIRINASGLKAGNGTYSRTICILEDVTERKKAEAEISKFKNISDNAIHGNAITDMEGNLVYINKSFANLHGYQPEELMGENLSIFHTRKQLARVEHLNKELVENGFYNHQEVWHVHRNGTEFPMLMSANVYKDETGKPIHLVANAIDISERVKAQQHLKQSEEKLRLAIDNSPLGITINDMQGNFISVNKAYEKIVGYTEIELLKMNFFDLTHPDYHPKNRELFEKMVKNQAPGYGIDKKYIHKNGGSVDVRIHAGSIHNEKEEVLFGMAFTEDITERKHNEEELNKHRLHLEDLVKERTLELEEKNEDLERFNKLFVGREFRIKELKEQIKELQLRISELEKK